LRSPDRFIQDLALLVADIHHRAVPVTELVDDSDGVVNVTGPGSGFDIPDERLLSPVADLPLRAHAPETDGHAQDRQAKKREAPTADLR
jgi:hypothetical protein